MVLHDDNGCSDIISESSSHREDVMTIYKNSKNSGYPTNCGMLNNSSNYSLNNDVSSSGCSSEVKLLQRMLKMRDLEMKCLSQSLVTRQDATISPCDHDKTLDDDEMVRFQSRRRRPIPNNVSYGQIQNDDYYYGPPKSTDDAHVISKPKSDDNCEVDRCINGCVNRPYVHDTCIKADYDRCTVLSSDDTSKKRKMISENDVSTMSLTQTGRTSAKNTNDLKFSVPLRSLHKLGSFGELLFTVSSKSNNTSKYRN